MRILLMFLLPLLLISCSQKEAKVDDTLTSSGQMSTGSAETVATKDPNEELIKAAVSDHFPLFVGLETKKIRVYHTSGTATRVTFKSLDASSMKVQLDFLDDKNPNLRLSRIVMPDGTMDGPFGVKTGYNLTQKGQYQLLFNENQMAGEPWSGVVDITIGLSGIEYPEKSVILP